MADSPKTPESKEILKNLVLSLVSNCIKSKMRKDETARHLWKLLGIPTETTNWAWEHIDRVFPGFFTCYYAMLQTSPLEVDSEMARRRPLHSGSGEQQQRRPTRRSLLATSQDFQRDAVASSSSQVPQEAPNANANANDVMEISQDFQRDAAASSSSQVPQEASNANADANDDFQRQAVASSSLQVPQEAPNANANANTNDEADFRQQLMVMLAKIERDTDQMVKLMTDIHGCGPHRSAAGCLKRQRVDQTKQSGDSEEAEKLQEKERGDNEETEKQREGSLKRQRIELTKESGDNEEAEKLQEKERSDNEEAEKLQEKERCNNEEAEKLQEKERGDNEETEKLQEKESCDNEEAEKLQNQNLQLSR